MTADLVLQNGTVLIPAEPLRGENALAVADGRVIALGDACSRVSSGLTTVIDLAGRCIIPGLVDAHCHLIQYGLSHRREADLRGCSSLGEIASRLAEHRASVGLIDDGRTWLLGRNFDQDCLSERRWPTHADLDTLPWRGPVCVTRVCGHARVINSAALTTIRATQPSFPERESGLYTEDDMGPIYAALPAPTRMEWREAARWATATAARAGFTTVHCLVGDREEIRALAAARVANKLSCRLRLQTPYGLLASLDDLGLPPEDPWLSRGEVKLFADGSLGAHTAALSAPYHDEPSSSGELLLTAEQMAGMVARVWRAGFQPCVHAIGDRAVAEVVEAYERAGACVPLSERPLGRPRVEHASIVRPETIEKLARLEVACCVQPQFVRSDWWAEERLGPARVRWAYPFRDLLDAGVELLGGTDCPVEELSGPAALGCAVARPGAAWARRHGQELTLAEALRLFCPGEAPLRPGAPADFLVLTEDPRTVTADGLERLALEQTWIGGRCVEETGG